MFFCSSNNISYSVHCCSMPSVKLSENRNNLRVIMLVMVKHFTLGVWNLTFF